MCIESSSSIVFHHLVTWSLSHLELLIEDASSILTSSENSSNSNNPSGRKQGMIVLYFFIWMMTAMEIDDLGDQD